MNVSLKEGDMNVRIDKGDVNIRQDEGNYNHTVGGDYNLEVKGHMHTVVGGDVVNEIGGSRDERIDGEFDQKYLTNEASYLGEYLMGEKRTYVKQDIFIQVDESIQEKCKYKKQKIDQDYEIQTSNYDLKTNSMSKIDTETFILKAKKSIKIGSEGNFDIFSSGASPLNIYSDKSLHLVAKQYAELSSMGSQVELNSPSSVNARSPKLRYVDLQNGPGFKAPTPPGLKIEPSNLQDPEETKNYMKNNKKQWTPTNSKK